MLLVSLALAADSIPLIVGGKQVAAEVADTPQERAIGLMGRASLAPDAGMLFVYPDEAVRSFWMKNTRIPLSIAFINDDGKVLQIDDMRPFDLTSVPSRFVVRYALEVDKGWYNKACLLYTSPSPRDRG